MLFIKFYNEGFLFMRSKFHYNWTRIRHYTETYICEATLTTVQAGQPGV